MSSPDRVSTDRQAAQTRDGWRLCACRECGEEAGVLMRDGSFLCHDHAAEHAEEQSVVNRYDHPDPFRG